MAEEPTYETVSKFDKARASLDGIALFTKPSTLVITETRGTANMTNKGETFIVEMARTEYGDYCFLQWIDETRTVRIVMPPKVVDAMVRGKEALAKRNRSRRAKAAMKERMAAGYVPHFVTHKIARKRKPKAKKQ